MVRKLRFASLFWLILSTSFAQNSSEQRSDKVYDYETRRYYDVCSIEPDGNYIIAFNCKTQDSKLSFLMSKKEERKIRKPNEISKVITPPSELAIWNNAIVKVHTSLENNQSMLTIYKTTIDTLKKYGRSTGWKAETSTLFFEVKEKEGYKIGDIWCVKNEATGTKVPIRISRLFKGGPYLMADDLTINKRSYEPNSEEMVLKFNSLTKCSEEDIVKFNLNQKSVTISAPQKNDEKSINSLHSPKETIEHPISPNNGLGNGMEK